MEGTECLLALDVSTKTIGIALFEMNGTLLELTHITPKPKLTEKEGKGKTESLILKSENFKDYIIDKYSKYNITDIVIEEPLLLSNNANTVGVLKMFNGMVTKECYRIFGITPNFISTYDSRKIAFPELMQLNKYGKITLFGGFPKTLDKKMHIWELVSERVSGVKWIYDKKGKLSSCNFDMSDAYTCGLAHLKNIGAVN